MPAVFVVLALAMVHQVFCQGSFLLSTETAPTRVGSLDGPLAGPEIWAQAFGGFTADKLEPVGVSVPHIGGGFVFGLGITVPGADVNQTIFVQMAAWNGTVWGTSFAGVPSDQLGFTDIVRVLLASPTGNPSPTEFTRPAIVPVPEPAAFTLIEMGTLGWLLMLRRHRPHLHPKPHLVPRPPDHRGTRLVHERWWVQGRRQSGAHPIISRSAVGATGRLRKIRCTACADWR